MLSTTYTNLTHCREWHGLGGRAHARPWRKWRTECGLSSLECAHIGLHAWKPNEMRHEHQKISIHIRKTQLACSGSFIREN